MKVITERENETLNKILNKNEKEIGNIKDNIKMKEETAISVQNDIKSINENISIINDTKLEVQVAKISSSLIEILFIISSIIFSYCIYGVVLQPVFLAMLLAGTSLNIMNELKVIYDNDKYLKGIFSKGLKGSDEILNKLKTELKLKKSFKETIEKELSILQTKLSLLIEMNNNIEEMIPKEIDVIDLNREKEEVKKINMKMSKEDFIRYVDQLSDRELDGENIKTDMIFNSPKLTRKK